jgi:hypothetical protein
MQRLEYPDLTFGLGVKSEYVARQQQLMHLRQLLIEIALTFFFKQLSIVF